MASSNNATEVLTIVLIIVIFSFINGVALILGQYNTSFKNLSTKFNEFRFIINIILLNLSLYLFLNYKISNPIILAVIYYFGIKKFIEILVHFKVQDYFITTKESKDKFDAIYSNVVYYTQFTSLLLDIYVIYFIFIKNYIAN